MLLNTNVLIVLPVASCSYSRVLVCVPAGAERGSCPRSHLFFPSTGASNLSCTEQKQCFPVPLSLVFSLESPALFLCGEFSFKGNLVLFIVPVTECSSSETTTDVSKTWTCTAAGSGSPHSLRLHLRFSASVRRTWK